MPAAIPRRLLVVVLVAALVAATAACNRDKKTPAEKAADAQKTPAERAAAQEEKRGTLGDLGVPQTAGECGAPPAPGRDPITLTDVTDTRGLVAPLVGMFGHAAAMEDVNGDGWLDLLAGTFADRAVNKYQLRGATAPAPDRLLLGGPKGFRVDTSFPKLYGRTSGATFADLDGDGDADLVLARDAKVEKSSKKEAKTASNDLPQGPTVVLRNNGSGRFELAGSIAVNVGARSVAVLDYDGDDKLDLFISRDPHSDSQSVLLRNGGNLTFSDATAAAGLPADLFGLGAAAADLNGDRRPDLFVTGSNRLFLNAGGRFREATTPVFAWPPHGNEDDVAGVAIADLDRDGRPDLVVGHHFNSTLDKCVKEPIRIYLNRDAAGTPRFEDVAKAAGVPSFPTKAPHIQLEDFDNDGWLDILATASSGAGTRPAILRHDAMAGSVPHFAPVQGLGSPQYWVNGMVADVDRDGRLDVYLTEFEAATASRLLRNETAKTGHWLDVLLGPGAYGDVVEIYRAGGLGDPSKLLARRELTTDVGYAAGAPSRLHFGLGPVTKVDVRVIPAWRGDPLDRPAVSADRRLDLSSP